MASLADVFTEMEMKNWLKSWLALEIAKSGLEHLADSEAQSFHWLIYSQVGSTCNSCATTHLQQNKQCPRKICDKVCQEIIKEHRYNNWSWKNTSAQLWRTNYWEIAKCYFPPNGYAATSSIQDTDFNGVISFMLNCRRFDSKFSFPITTGKPTTHMPACLLYKAREIGKAVHHSSIMKVTDVDLQDYFTTFTNLLSDPRYLSQDSDAQCAVQKLEELKKDTLLLTTHETILLLETVDATLKQHLKNVAKHVVDTSVNELRENTALCIDKIKDYLNTCKQELTKHAYMHKYGIKEQTDTGKHEKREQTGTGKQDIKKHIDTGKQVIKEQTDIGKQEIKQQTDTGKQEIKKQTSLHLFRSLRSLEQTDTETFYGQSCEVPFEWKNTGDHLRNICQIQGRKSQQLMSACETICKTIRSIENVDDVFPAIHKDDQTKVVFVITHTGDCVKHVLESTFKDDNKIDYIVKPIDCFESSAGFQIEKGDLLKQDEERLQNFINTKSKILFSKHQYLTFIQGASIKRNEDNAFRPLLVFYVPAKGYIPIDEEPFDQSYEDISVTVQEGVFVPFSQYADDVNDPVRMGCRIEHELAGTLGVFIDHPDFKICGLTCAHVLLDQEEIKSCTVKGNGNIQLKDNTSDYDVYQPYHPHDIGRIRGVIIKEGNGHYPGLEIAIIQLLNRIPQHGQFPESRETYTEGVQFNSGKIADYTKYIGQRCFKFGIESDFTEGKILNALPHAVAIRTKNRRKRIHLVNQIHVQHQQNNRFARRGDSGGPVFVRDNDMDIACIGLIEGGVSGAGVTFVTPITAILNAIYGSLLILRSFASMPP